MPTTLHENRPSAGIGVVEVQKLEVFCDFGLARATLCGDWGGRGAKTQGVFCDFVWARATLCGDRRGRGAKFKVFFAISAVLARSSAGIGVVEVQKLEVFCDFVWARATLCGDRRGRGTKTRGFLRFLRCSRNPLRGSAWSRCKNSRFFASFVVRTGPRELSRGSRACSRDRRVTGSILVRGASQAAQSNLHKATCAEQLAPVCAERLA